MRDGYDLEVKWIAFPLHPETPEEGLSLERLFAGRDIDIGQVLARMTAVAEAEGLPFGPRTHTYNSRLAQELGKWAEEMDAGEEFHRAAFEAYFADGVNLARKEVLTSLAESVGLDPGEAREILEERAYALKVDEDWNYARASGVMAVPTFGAGGRMVVGAQSYETLEALVVSAGAGSRFLS